MDHNIKGVKLSINKWKDTLNGIMLFKTNNLIGMINNPIDYVLDGYTYVNRNKIVNESLIEDDLFQKIICLKVRDYLSKKSLKIPNFKSFEELFGYLKVKGIFCELALSKENIIYLGKVIDVRTNEMDIDFYNTNFEILDNAFVKYQDITRVTIFSDYSMTFENVIKKKW